MSNTLEELQHQQQAGAGTTKQGCNNTPISPQQSQSHPGHASLCSKIIIHSAPFPSQEFLDNKSYGQLSKVGPSLFWLVLQTGEQQVRAEKTHISYQNKSPTGPS